MRRENFKSEKTDYFKEIDIMNVDDIELEKVSWYSLFLKKIYFKNFNKNKLIKNSTEHA